MLPELLAGAAIYAVQNPKDAYDKTYETAARVFGVSADDLSAVRQAGGYPAWIWIAVGAMLGVGAYVRLRQEHGDKLPDWMK